MSLIPEQKPLGIEATGEQRPWMTTLIQKQSTRPTPQADPKPAGHTLTGHRQEDLNKKLKYLRLANTKPRNRGQAPESYIGDSTWYRESVLWVSADPGRF